MKLVSFEGIGQVLATFEAEEGVREGQVVKVSGPGPGGPLCRRRAGGRCGGGRAGRLCLGAVEWLRRSAGQRRRAGLGQALRRRQGRYEAR